MHVVDTAIAPFGPEHLDPAVRLSRQAGWPHRLEDWQMALAISEGFVAVEGDGKVAGTILLTPYGEDCATINMVIVDEATRGRGLGRRLMDAALTRAAGRPLRLTATAEGLPLYRKLGFVETGTVVQHQGIAGPVAAPDYTEAARPDDITAIAELDRAAYGADRRNLIAEVDRRGRPAVAAGRLATSPGRLANGTGDQRRFRRGRGRWQGGRHDPAYVLWRGLRDDQHGHRR